MIDGLLAQPRIWLSAADEAQYPTLADAFHLRRSAILVVCFFQSIVLAKCYGRWREVLTLLSQQLARSFPQQEVDVLLACGPDEDLPPGVQQADVAEEFSGFTGGNQHLRTLVRATPSLRDLAIIVKHASLVLSNDTGPGHLAGALQVPTIVPYLPGQVYSKMVWASTPWHHGVTLEPNPFSRERIEAAVLWDRTDIIDSIPPEDLVAEAFATLERSRLNDGYRTPHSSAIAADRRRSTSAARCPPRRPAE
jgi:ADP-heptose:LPS heptosyltransferase